MADNKGPSIGARHQQCLLLFCCMAIGYALQANLSVAIVAMTDRHSANPDFEEYHWDEKTKSTVLSSFIWGYLLTQVPGGQLSNRFGGKLPLFLAVLACSILNFSIPLCAGYGGWKLVVVTRVLQGLFQGILYPATHALLSHWSPIDERGYLGILCYSGCQVGTVVMLATSGIVASSSLGWPAIFYIWGSLGVLWCGCWHVFGANSPAEHKSITYEERKFIENSLGKTEDTPKKKHLKTPWLSILTSVPFLALLFTMCAQNWGFWMLLTEIPTYMNGVLGMDIKSNALLSAIPHFAMFVMSFIFCYFSVLMGKKKDISLSMNRKIFNTIGIVIPGIALLILGYVTKENPILAIVLLTITVGVTAGVYFGYHINLIDLSPNFAGILMGIANGAANIVGMISIFTVGFVVSDESDASQWQILFFITAGLYLVGSIVFIVFGTAEVQPWDLPHCAKPVSTKEDEFKVEVEK